MGGPGPLSDAGKKLLGTAVSACPKPEDNVVAYDAGFTYGDVHNLLASYYGYNINEHIEPATDSTRDGVLTSLFMNAIPGSLCVKDLGPRANRLLADQIDDSCEEGVITGPGAEEKCEALYDAVDARAEESTGQSILKYLGYTGAAVGTTVGTWAIFGPGMTVWHSMSTGQTFVGAVRALHAARAAATAVTATEAGFAALPVIGVVGAFAGGLAVGHGINKGLGHAGLTGRDGDKAFSSWLADGAYKFFNSDEFERAD